MGGGGNFGMAVRASILKPTPIIYLALKNSPFISLISKKDDIFIYVYVLSFELIYPFTGPRIAVDNVSGNRCESDCRSRGREFYPGLVPYFRGN